MRNLVLVALGALLVASCDAKVTEPSDKNTNWLRQCSASTQCGVGLQCLCGVCTSVCDRDEQCSDQDPNAVCTAFAGPRCGSGVATVCSVRCEGSSACSEHDADLVCVDRVCEPASSANDAGTDPDTGAAAGSGSPSPEAGTVAPPVPLGDAGSTPVLTPATLSAVAEGCGAGFRCDAFAAVTGSVMSFVVEEDAIAWVDWGTNDGLGNHRVDGAVVRMPKSGSASERVHEGLDRPFKLWLDDGQYYWLSGDPADFAANRGLQTLYRAPHDDSSPPTALKTMLLSHMQLRRGAMLWIEPYESEEPGIERVLQHSLLQWDLSSWNSIYFFEARYALHAMDDDSGYLGDGGNSIVRVTFGGMPTEVVSDPPAFLPSVSEDALWLIHTAPDGTDWVSSMPKAGGAVTHVARAGDYLGAPQAGQSVVWLLRSERPGTYGLWSLPRTGTVQELVLSWPTPGDVPIESAPAPAWIADGDQAWVFAHGAVIRVSRQ